MSDIVRNSTSFRKRAQQDSILPSPGNKTLVFHHQASGGESTITLSSLTVPTLLSGYANPSLSDMLGSRLSIYPGSMTLVSSLNGILQPDVTWKCNTPSVITFLNSYTLTNGEIITGIIRPVNTDGVLVTDARALAVTGTLTAGNDTIVTNPFTLNKYSGAQVGDVLVFLNGQLQMRNVGNATAAPSADGNYQEVPVAGGLTNQIKLNSPVGTDTTYVVVSNGLVAERPTNSLLAAVEAVQGKIDAMIPDLAALAGVPTTNYSTQTPTNVDLASFGQSVLDLINRVTALEAPIVTRITSGSGSFVPNAKTKYMKVRIAGPGGGGGAGGTGGPGTGSNGTSTTFSTMTANGGGGGNTGGGGAAAGGTADTTGFPTAIGIQGSSGQAGTTAGSDPSGGALGGMSPLGRYGGNPANGASAASTGGHGGGGGGRNGGGNTGGGGGAGAYIEVIITNPTSNGSFQYAIGVGGNGGSAVTNGYSGGKGGDGEIWIEEY